MPDKTKPFSIALGAAVSLKIIAVMDKKTARVNPPNCVNNFNLAELKFKITNDPDRCHLL